MELRMNNPSGVFSIGMPSLTATSLAAPLPPMKAEPFWDPLPGTKRGSYALCCSELNRSVILVADRPPAPVAVTLA